MIQTYSLIWYGIYNTYDVNCPVSNYTYLRNITNCQIRHHAQDTRHKRKTQLAFTLASKTYISPRLAPYSYPGTLDSVSPQPFHQ